MPTKIFTTIEQECPFGKGCDIDSLACRNCPDYFRVGTGMFFWCKREVAEEKPASKHKPKKTTAAPGKKRGRPRKAEKRPK